MSDEVQQIVKGLKIPYLLHFTRAVNLPSIVNHGLQPVAAFKALKIEAAINDDLRLDRRLNGISVSIAHPNGKMFYKLRKDNPDVEWAILAIHPRILWEKDVLFCKHNAADCRISGSPDEELRKPATLAALFDEVDGCPTRQEQVLRPFDPTDVQAEVLVLDIIEPQHIASVAFDSDTVRAKFASVLGDRQVITQKPSKGLFAERTYRRRYGT